MFITPHMNLNLYLIFVIQEKMKNETLLNQKCKNCLFLWTKYYFLNKALLGNYYDVYKQICSIVERNIHFLSLAPKAEWTCPEPFHRSVSSQNYPRVIQHWFCWHHPHLAIARYLVQFNFSIVRSFFAHAMCYVAKRDAFSAQNPNLLLEPSGLHG